LAVRHFRFRLMPINRKSPRTAECGGWPS
jgi:hypothetical protein